MAAAPRSVMAKLIEVRAVIDILEREDRRYKIPGNISVKVLRSKLPRKVSGGGSQYADWTQGIGDHYLQDYLRAAKTCRYCGIEHFLDDIERFAESPENCVKPKLLFAILSVEMKQEGFVKRILESYVEMLLQNNKKTLNVVMSAAEKKELPGRSNPGWRTPPKRPSSTPRGAGKASDATCSARERHDIPCTDPARVETGIAGTNSPDTVLSTRPEVSDCDFEELDPDEILRKVDNNLDAAVSEIQSEWEISTARWAHLNLIAKKAQELSELIDESCTLR